MPRCSTCRPRGIVNLLRSPGNSIQTPGELSVVRFPTDGLKFITHLRDANSLPVSLSMIIYDKGAVGFWATQAGAFNYLGKPFPLLLEPGHRFSPGVPNPVPDRPRVNLNLGLASSAVPPPPQRASGRLQFSAGSLMRRQTKSGHLPPSTNFSRIHE